MQIHRCDGPTLYCDSQEKVDALIEELKDVSRVALDTEADSLHHYYEKVCLIQLSFCGRHVLVDPLSAVDLSGLLELLANKVLVIHGADYDLRMLRRCYGFVAGEIFDTMLAAQLLGYKQLGLAALTERHCGVVLSKHGQKADWSKRPLTPALIEYATNDTRHLLCIAERLTEELKAKGRLAWHQEECRRLVAAVALCREGHVRNGDWRVKGWHTLPAGRAHAILRELWKWREDEAEAADLPPFKIARSETLVELARWFDEHGTTSELPELPRNIRGGRLARLRQAAARALSLPRSEWPQRESAKNGRVRSHDKELFSRLREIRDAKAVELGLEGALLCPAAVLHHLADAKPKSLEELRAMNALSNWQIEILGEEFVATLAECAPSEME